MTTALIVPMTPDEARSATDNIRRVGSEMRGRLVEFNERRGWAALGHASLSEWARVEFPDWDSNYALRQIRAGAIERDINRNLPDVPMGTSKEVRNIPERQLRPLADVPPAERAEVWQEAVATAPAGKLTAAHVQATVERRQPATPVLVEKPSVTSARQDVQPIAAHKAASVPTFNRTNDNVDWAWWTWNPVTGCLHDCPYCYARDIANRFYPQKFVPTFHEDRLDAPRFSKLPASDDPRARRVFTCSMADLFGKWVPQEWIDAVFGQVRDNPQWEFLFLTKFPQRLAELDWPDNAWVGTTVDSQRRVEIAERSFRGVKAGVKWLSCEPMMERLTFTSLEMFDWVVIGGASASSQTPAFTPPSEWVEHLLMQARAAGCKVYFKDNLLYQPKEQPRSSKG